MNNDNPPEWDEATPAVLPPPETFQAPANLTEKTFFPPGVAHPGIPSVSEPDLKNGRRPKSMIEKSEFPDRLPPHAPDMEMGVLGCILFDPNSAYSCIESCLDKKFIKLDFYDLRHQTIYESCYEMFTQELPIDLITVQQHLKDRKMLDQVGGIAYLSQLQDAVPSAANLTYYIEKVKEKSKFRNLIQTCSAIAARVHDHTGDADELFLEVEAQLASLSEPKSDLPAIEEASDFAVQEIAKPAELVEGMLHKGSKLVFGGSSKSFKTWCLLDLALSVASGIPWMGRNTHIGKVLFLNFEIQRFAFQSRILAIAEAKQKVPAPGLLNIWNLRGHTAHYKVIIPKIIAKAKKEGYSLIVLDPIYKLYGNTDENSASDVADMLNSIERLATETGAAVAFGAHFAKGNASGKEAIDRISGSGVFARDPDSILVFTKHEEDDAFAVEPILRNFPSIPPFAVRWDFPLMLPDVELDPTKLKAAPGRKQSVQPDVILPLLPPEGLTRKNWLDLALEKGVSERTFDRLKNQLKNDGKILLSAVSGKYTPISLKNTYQ